MQDRQPPISLNFRIPAEIHAKMKTLAEEDLRSLNDELIVACREFIVRREEDRRRRRPYGQPKA